MNAQSAIVALLVIGCSAYAAWTLMPSAGRRAIALTLLKLPLPQRAVARLQKHLAPVSGCGCDGCDLGTKKKADPPGTQQIRFHPRVKR